GAFDTHIAAPRVAIAAHEADDLRGQAALRVDALGDRLGDDAQVAQPGNLLRHFAGDRPGQEDIDLVVVDGVKNVSLVVAQGNCQVVRHLCLIDDQAWADADPVFHCVPGQQFHVPVKDAPAIRDQVAQLAVGIAGTVLQIRGGVQVKLEGCQATQQQHSNHNQGHGQ